MRWMLWYNLLMRYYPGLNHLNIPKMTLWQFVQSVKNMGWIEKQGREEQGDMTSETTSRAALGNTGEVPSIAEIRAMARQINPDLVIPKG